MEIKQIYDLVNTITKEVTGQENLVSEDLGNIVDVGTTLANLGSNAVDAYVRSLVNHIGKVIFVNRKYSGGAPDVMMDGWEYGSILEKISAALPEATENESWELTDGATYDPNQFYKPTVTSKFFNKRVTFEIPMSFTERQVKQSFSNREQLNGFISMLQNEVDKSKTIKTDELIMRTINNMIGETVYDDFNATSSFSAGSHVKAVNLLYLYNERYPDANLAADDALSDPDFIRFACFVMGNYVDRMRNASTLFNIGEQVRFTPRDRLKIVLHSDFANGAKVFLQSDTFHKELVSLPVGYSTVPYWQGTGNDFDFGNTGKILAKTVSGNSMTVKGVVGVMFDHDALGVCNIDSRVTTNYNPKGEFWNNWYKFDAGYFNDWNESFCVFFVE